MNELIQIPSQDRQPIYFTDVTLRDGEQQEKAEANMPIEDRIMVFDSIVDTGITRVEIGHLGNNNDTAFARQLVGHIAEKSAAGDERYDEVELQVLFGSQVELTDGIDALEGFDTDRVIVHVYDRVSPELRRLATDPYTIGQSANRVIEAASQMIDKGYKNFSISGEGTVDPAVSAEAAAIDFYLPVIDALREAGAGAINVNLPNTFGSSLGGEWTQAGIEDFNSYIKEEYPDVTTSIHIHNDHNSAVEVSMAAIEAGFDSIEGTMIGMGERSGNVALVDVMTRLLEDARHVVEVQDRWESASQIAKLAVSESFWHHRSIDTTVLGNIDEWHAAANSIGAIYGTMNRFHKTSLGNIEAYGAGSGPHAQANQEALRDPVSKPLWRNYGRVALVHAMMGRPEAEQIIAIDSERYREITLDTHAAGGSTQRILADQIVECSDESRHEAVEVARQEIDKIFAVVADQPADPPKDTEMFADEQPAKSNLFRLADHPRARVA